MEPASPAFILIYIDYWQQLECLTVFSSPQNLIRNRIR